VDQAEAAHARHDLRRDHRAVLDAVVRVAPRRLALRSLEGVQQQRDRAVAVGVHAEPAAGAVDVQHQRVQLRGRGRLHPVVVAALERLLR